LNGAVGVLILTASGVVTALLTVPMSVGLARRIGAIDQPGDLKVHTAQIPRLGGVGIMTTVVAYTLLVSLARPLLADQRIHIVVASSLLITAIGVVDDLRGLRQTNKFLVEGLVAFGVVWVVFGSPTLWLIPAWIVFMGLINGYNFLDGLDGLAGGIAAVNLLALAVLSLVAGLQPLAGLGLAAAGACLGFLRFNWAPARVFMGDGGSLGIGCVIATSSLILVEDSSGDLRRVAAVSLAASLPLAEAAFTGVRRVVALRSLRPQTVFAGDRDHSYDQMQAKLGMTTVRVVTINISVAAAVAFLGLLAFDAPPAAAAAFVVLATALIVGAAARYRVTIRQGPTKGGS
jgi:UDP-GlcNAc:undecaprenyl-phosphate GlcNAc-1-phosphate transferase